MSVSKKFKAAGARPKKMACGGRVKMQSGGQSSRKIVRRWDPQAGQYVTYDLATGKKVSPGATEVSTKGMIKQATTGSSSPSAPKKDTSVRGLITRLMKEGMSQAQAVKKANYNKKRGIKYLKK